MRTGLDCRQFQKVRQQDLALAKGDFTKRFKKIARVLCGFGWRQIVKRRCR